MNQQKDKTKLLRSFGFVMGGMLCIFTGVFFYKKWLPAAGTLGFLALCFILFALIAPGKLEKIHAGWMKFGEAIGRFNSKIILGALFLLFFTAFRGGLFLLRKDFLQRKFEPAKETYWKNRKPAEINIERYEQQY